jgi:hypothetical protein
LKYVRQESGGPLKYGRREKISPEGVAEIHRELFRK